MRKGLAFSIDSLFALAVVTAIVPVLMVVSFHQSEEKIFSFLQTEAEDSIDVVAKLRIADVRQENVINGLFSRGILSDSDINSTLIETLGSFWASENATLVEAANNVSKEIIGRIIPASVDWRLTIDDEHVYNSSINISRTLALSKRVLSGVAKGKASSGFMASAFVKGIEKMSSSYFFFGGFVGQGNMTVVVRDIPQNSQINSVYLELNSANNLSLYANSALCGQLTVKGNISVDKWLVTEPSCLGAIYGGAENNFTLNFTGDIINSFVGGGFLRVSYTTEEFLIPTEKTNRHYFPGVEGLVNIYDSFYVRGNLSSMNVTLRYKTGVNYSVVMSVGNGTILNRSSNGTVEDVFIDSSSIESSLATSGVSYSYLSGRTIPIRLLVSANITGGMLNGDTDIVLITDRSGSMDWRLDQDSVSGLAVDDCGNASIYDNSTKRISLAKCLAKDFVNSVLGSEASRCPTGTVTGNRVALVSFGTSAPDADSLDLTDNLTQLTNAIDGYSANLGSTCVPCAINRAWDILNRQSNSSRIKYVIVMTDGEANIRATPTCSSTYAVDAKTSDKFVAGDIGSRLAKLTNIGWEEVYSPVTDIMRGVAVLNSTLAFAVGDSAKILAWNGSLWSEMDDFGSFSFRDIGVLDGSLAFAVGDSGRIYRWDGASWSLHQDVGSANLLGVGILNSTRAFAVGSSAKIFAWDGNSWSQINDFGNFNINDVVFVNSTLAFAVGDSGRIYRWDGASWSLHQDVGSANLLGVDAAQDMAFAVGTSGKIYAWTGGSWSEDAGTGAESHNDVSIFNSTLAFAVSSNGDSGNAVLHSWNGSRWELFKPFVRYAYSGNLTTGAACSDSDTDSLSLSQSYPSLNANYSAFRIVSNFSNATNVTIDSIGFGPVTNPARVLARETLQAIAVTGNGTYYSSSDGQTLQTIYCQIAENINTRLTLTQIVALSGNLTPATLYASFVDYKYNSSVSPPDYQEISVNRETTAFQSCNGSFFIPSPLKISDSKVTSYTFDMWTSLVTLQGGVVHNLSEYRKNFTEIGDPFIVHIPEEMIEINKTNRVNISLGNKMNVINESCSADNRLIYTARFRGSVPYGDVLPKSSGGVYSIYFDKDSDGYQDGSFNVVIGADLPGFDPVPKDVSSLDSGNAVEDALQRLLDSLNFAVYGFNSGQSGSASNPVDIELTDVSIDSRSISAIPFTWGPADIKIEVGI